MFDLEELQSFVAVADAGGVTAAARRLGLTKSIVSRRLVRLEQDLGVQLLLRTTRGAALTDAGATFRDHAAQVVTELETARDAVSTDGELRGVLRVSAPLAFGPTFLAPIFAELALAHPKLHVHVSYSDAMIDIVTEGYDAAVRTGHLASSTLVARRFFSVQGRFVASPDYVARHGVPGTLDEIPQHEAILLRNDPWPATVRGKRVLVPARGRFQADNGIAILTAALAGVGIAILPDFLADEPIARGELIPFLEAHLPPPAPIHVVRPPAARTPRKVAVLTDLLVERFAHRA